MIQVLLAVMAFIAVVGWLLAFGSSIDLVMRHRLEDHSISWYALNGYVYFDPSSFAPSGKHAHRRMMVGVGLFVLGAFGGALVTVIGNAL